jgi:6-phosphogluconolactonase (cycloisomerase 2 family)
MSSVTEEPRTPNVRVIVGSRKGESTEGSFEFLAVDEKGVLRRTGGVPGQPPTFLVAHPTLAIVYALHEHSATVVAYRGGDFTKPWGRSFGSGDAACYLAVEPHGRYLVAACWGDGAVLYYPLAPDGEVLARIAAPDVDPPEGRGARRPRAHAAVILDDGRVVTTDIGRDLVRVWTVDPQLGLMHQHDVVLPTGAEPRLMALHPSGRVFVVAEAELAVYIVVPKPGGRLHLESRHELSTDGPTQGDKAADVTLSDALRALHVGVRGSNVLLSASVSPDGSSIKPLASRGAGGDWPRYHAEHGKFLVVANEHSDEVAVFALDPVTSAVGDRLSTIRVLNPTSAWFTHSGDG